MNPVKGLIGFCYNLVVFFGQNEKIDVFVEDVRQGVAWALFSILQFLCGEFSTLESGHDKSSDFTKKSTARLVCFFSAF